MAKCRLIYLLLLGLWACGDTTAGNDVGFPVDGGRGDTTSVDADRPIDGSLDAFQPPVEPCSEGPERFVGVGPYVIDCVMDLGGQLVELPANIELRAGGGYLRNGTLRFQGGTIEGPLLTLSLRFEGDGRLAEPVFGFLPQR